jgi:hypothetical protein
MVRAVKRIMESDVPDMIGVPPHQPEKHYVAAADGWEMLVLDTVGHLVDSLPVLAWMFIDDRLSAVTFPNMVVDNLQNRFMGMRVRNDQRVYSLDGDVFPNFMAWVAVCTEEK